MVMAARSGARSLARPQPAAPQHPAGRPRRHVRSQSSREPAWHRRARRERQRARLLLGAVRAAEQLARHHAHSRRRWDDFYSDWHWSYRDWSDWCDQESESEGGWHWSYRDWSDWCDQESESEGGWHWSYRDWSDWCDRESESEGDLACKSATSDLAWDQESESESESTESEQSAESNDENSVESELSDSSNEGGPRCHVCDKRPMPRDSRVCDDCVSNLLDATYTAQGRDTHQTILKLLGPVCCVCDRRLSLQDPPVCDFCIKGLTDHSIQCGQFRAHSVPDQEFDYVSIMWDRQSGPICLLCDDELLRYLSHLEARAVCHILQPDAAPVCDCCLRRLNRFRGFEHWQG